MPAGSARTLGWGRYAFQAGDSHAKSPPPHKIALQLCNSGFYKQKSRLTDVCM